MKKNKEVDFYGFRKPGNSKRRKRVDHRGDAIELAKLGTGILLATAMIGVTAGLASQAFSS